MAPLSFQLSPATGPVPPFIPYEAAVPHLPTGAMVTMPPDIGGLISYIRFRSGTRMVPVPQTAVFQIALDG
jgi:hypothetical protein